jgi:hypothetical protein
MYKSYISTVGEPDDEGDPDIVYYNADIINNTSLEPVGTEDKNEVKFIETRSVPLINNLSNFEFSIIRFTMNGPSLNLPIHIPTIEIGQSDINKTTYKIGIRLKKDFIDSAGTPHTFDQFISRNIKYVSETTAFIINNLQLPQPPISQQDTRGIYYWIYTYGHFCKLFNDTINDIQNDLFLAYTAFQATFPAPSTNPNLIADFPKLVFNQSTNLFSIYYDVRSAGGAITNSSFFAATAEILELSLNNNLYNLFSNFESEFVGTQILSESNILKIVNKNFTNWVAPPAGFPLGPTLQPAVNGYWVMTQNYISTSTLWSPIASIVFTSTLIPIFSEQVGEPTVFGDSNNNSISSTSSAFQPIITDIALPLKTTDDYRQFIEYAPSAEYRMSAFTKSKQSLSNIDIQVYFKNRLDNSLYPIKMTNYSTVSIKMMFRKKKRLLHY